MATYVSQLKICGSVFLPLGSVSIRNEGMLYYFEDRTFLLHIFMVIINQKLMFFFP